jgi:TonB family protein
MVFEKSKLPSFILLSLGLHLVVVGILSNLEFEHEHLIPVEVTFSQGASGNGKSKGAEVLSEKKAPLKLRAETRPQLKSEVVTDAPKASLPQVANDAAAVGGEGGTGKNIGTGESGEGFGSGSGAETAKNQYFSLIAQTIYKNKRYPRQAYSLNQEGKVVVRLKLAKNGKILDLEVLEQATYKSLTNATIETIKSINKFPAIPEELKVDDITFRIPIEYKIQM